MLTFSSLGLFLGCEGPPGPAGPPGPPGQQTEREFRGGDTFTYWNQSLRLFSIRVTRIDDPYPTRIRIDNHNMPQIDINLFIRVLLITPESEPFVYEFPPTEMSIDETSSFSFPLAYTIIFGSPLPDPGALIPFARFDLSEINDFLP